MVSVQVEWSTGTSSQKPGRKWGISTLIADAEILEDPTTRRVWVFRPSRIARMNIYIRGLAVLFLVGCTGDDGGSGGGTTFSCTREQLCFESCIDNGGTWETP